MPNTTKRLTAGLLMAVTTFTVAGSTCFANQVCVFNDGTGCETARCYEKLSNEIFGGNHALRNVIEERIFKDFYETQTKMMYPDLVELAEQADESVCANFILAEEVSACKDEAYKKGFELLIRFVKELINAIKDND